MSKEYVAKRIAELGLTPVPTQGPLVSVRGMQLRRRKRALARDPVRVVACEICGRNPREARRGNQSLCLDHDHKTGAFRGWLCHGCNLGLGLLGDTEDALVRALAYLRRVRL